MSRHRGFTFTLNNYTQTNVDTLDKIFEKEAKYGVYGREIAPTTGTPHLQGYVYWKNAKTLSATIKTIGQGAHCEVAKGSPKDNQAYCTKEGLYKEYGELPEQGKRCDLDAIKNDIMNGKKVDDICIESPMVYHQYGRTLNKIEDIYLRKQYRKWTTTCEWIWGSTGTGKSHYAFKDYNPDTHYLWKLRDHGWQDGYTGQEIVIINDFRGEIAYNDLLDLLDKYYTTVNRRGREPAPFLAKHVIITSSLRPELVYNRRNAEDSLEQLLRRIEVKEFTQKYSGVILGPECKKEN